MKEDISSFRGWFVCRPPIRSLCVSFVASIICFPQLSTTHPLVGILKHFGTVLVLLVAEEPLCSTIGSCCLPSWLLGLNP